MKSVLLSNLSYFGRYGGVENSIRFLSQSLLKMNCDVTILYGYIKNDDRTWPFQVDGVQGNYSYDDIITNMNMNELKHMYDLQTSFLMG